MNRLGFIGGSDIAAILNVSPYKTAYQLYLEKIGETIQTEETEYQYWGKALEQAVRDAFVARTGLVVSKPDAIVHPQHSFLIGHLDGFIESEQAVLEIKCVSAYTKSKWDDGEIPLEYLLQAAFYCALKGCSKAYFAVLFGGNTYQQFHYEYDPILGEQILEAALQFWWHVDMRIPPELTQVSDFNKHYALTDNSSVEATEEVVQALAEIKMLRSEVELLEESINRCKMVVMQHMQAADVVKRGDAILATWKARKDGKRVFLIKD